jgi:tRNA threonylcarbamoyladenosine biosynthesis protein TsaE
VTIARVKTISASETQAVAAALAPLLRAGDLVLLGGPLGAGKTTFVKGLAAALGVTEAVTSPTFTLVRSYPTSKGWDLLHADVYRLEQLQEVIDLALPEQVEDGACAVIEWGERAAPALTPDYLSVTLEYAAEDEDARELRLAVEGQGWKERADQVAEAVSPLC